MIKRAAALLSAAVLVLLLAGCGSSGSSRAQKSASDDSGTSSSPSASSSSAPAASKATGADYRNLLAALLQQQSAVQAANTAQQINQKAHFPQGVSVAQFDKASKMLCIQNDPKAIALTFSTSNVVLHSGSCANGKDVATLSPQGKNNLSVTGDKALAEPGSHLLHAAVRLLTRGQVRSVSRAGAPSRTRPRRGPVAGPRTGCARRRR